MRKLSYRVLCNFLRTKQPVSAEAGFESKLTLPNTTLNDGPHLYLTSYAKIYRSLITPLNARIKKLLEENNTFATFGEAEISWGYTKSTNPKRKENDISDFTKIKY